jgi:hypothetical protein
MPVTKILYSGFYDAPHAFVTNYNNAQYLFRRGYFDDELDDYPNEYEVFILPNLSEADIKESWLILPEKTVACVGKIPVDQVVFDPTKRISIDVATFERIVK